MKNIASKSNLALSLLDISYSKITLASSHSIQATAYEKPSMNFFYIKAFQRIGLCYPFLDISYFVTTLVSSHSIQATALEMIHDIREAFNELLEENDWMDPETRKVAEVKNLFKKFKKSKEFFKKIKFKKNVFLIFFRTKPTA